MNYDQLAKCPTCGNKLIISELSCKNCGIAIKGNFDLNGFPELTENDLEFVKNFILSDGNISKLQVSYQETYLSIKNRLNAIKIKLGEQKMMNDIKIEELTVENGDSKVVAQLKNKIIASGGKALMPVLKGDSVPFWLSSALYGFESEGLRGVVLEWKIFDAIVKKAISLGGKMYRGDSAAQSGARIGSDDLPTDTIDGYISTEFYGAKIGDTTLRRSTYYSGILNWAGIATNHRSQGHGGFITINPEFMSLE